MATIASRYRSKGTPLVMGILNVTPDSFYPGSRSPDPASAVDAATLMVDQGAELLDVGGESTRPGSEPVPPDQERHRIVPVVQALVDQFDVPVSVDTRRASTAQAALEAGASIVNDVSAGGDDDRMFEVVADHGADLVLMHMKGRPRTMQKDPSYDDVVAEVEAFLRQRLEAARKAGVPEGSLVVDPGLGFGKRLHHNLSLIGATERLAGLAPVLLGVSRKSMFQALLGRSVEERLPGSLAVAAWGALHGAAVLRVHDVAETVDVVETLRAIQEASP